MQYFYTKLALAKVVDDRIFLIGDEEEISP